MYAFATIIISNAFIICSYDDLKQKKEAKKFAQSSELYCCFANDPLKDNKSSVENGTASSTGGAAPLSTIPPRVKTAQEIQVDGVATLVAPMLKRRPSKELTASQAHALSDELRKWALKQCLFESEHLNDEINLDEQHERLTAKAFHRHSGNNYGFDRGPIIAREIEAIKRATNIECQLDENSLIRAIRRMNPSHITAKHDELEKVEAENAELEAEKQRLEKELAQLEGTNS